MDTNEDYLDSLLNSVINQDSQEKSDDSESLSGDHDMTEFLDTMSGDSELEEINDLLKKSDQSQMLDDDMLAMLEQADQSEPSNSPDNAPEAFDIFASDGLEDEENENGGEKTEDEKNDIPADIDFFADQAGEEDLPSDNPDKGKPAEDHLGEADDMDALLKGLMSADQTEDAAENAGAAPVEDLFSLDSLQTEEEPDESDEGIQNEIDELLGLKDHSAAADSGQPDSDMQDIFGGGGTGQDGEAASGPEGAAVKEKGGRRKKGRGKGLFKKSKAAKEDQENENAEETADDKSLAEEAEQTDRKERRKAKKEKAKKEKNEKKEKKEKQKAAQEEGGNAEEQPDKEKKPGFFARIYNGLFDEVGESDESDELQGVNISEENKEILEMMDGEKVKDAKPDKKKKSPKGKKGQKGGKKSGDIDDDEDKPADIKKAKKAQKAKEKREERERKKAEQAEEAASAKKLPMGKVFSIAAVCATLLAVIVLLAYIVPSQSDLKKARKAYYEHDYMTVYQNMHGRDLNDSDYILYMRSLLVLNMQSKLDNYSVYMGMDKEMTALNELMLAVDYYQSNRSVAEGYGALNEMNEVYAQVLSLLQDEYQLGEQDAIDIFALDDLGYNQKLYYLIHGTEFTLPEGGQSGQGDGNSPQQTGDAPLDIDQSLNGNDNAEDLLREEEEMLTEISQVQPADGGQTQKEENTGGLPTGQEGAGIAPNGNHADSEETGNDENVDNAVGGQDGNMPSGALNQGNGDVLYTGEVENGNVVLQ